MNMDILLWIIMQCVILTQILDPILIILQLSFQLDLEDFFYFWHANFVLAGVRVEFVEMYKHKCTAIFSDFWQWPWLSQSHHLFVFVVRGVAFSEGKEYRCIWLPYRYQLLWSLCLSTSGLVSVWGHCGSLSSASLCCNVLDSVHRMHTGTWTVQSRRSLAMHLRGRIVES